MIFNLWLLSLKEKCDGTPGRGGSVCDRLPSSLGAIFFSDGLSCVAFLPAGATILLAARV